VVTLAKHAPSPSVAVHFTTTARAAPITGRLALVLAKAAQPEPRYTISARNLAVFAIHLDAQRPGSAAIVDDNSVGYSRARHNLPPGDYYAQAVINIHKHV
jgi:hypothetical protein